jgi:protocatechuate 3,4-dioxygenase beta subunit
MQVYKRGQVAASMMPREFRLRLRLASVPSPAAASGLGHFFFRIRPGHISFSVTPRKLETRLQRVRVGYTEKKSWLPQCGRF